MGSGVGMDIELRENGGESSPAWLEAELRNGHNKVFPRQSPRDGVEKGLWGTGLRGRKN